MGLYTWPYHLDFELGKSDAARPDGPVPLRIHGPALVQAVGARGHLDFQSLRVVDMNIFPHEWGRDVMERDSAVQFVPDADFDPTRQPSGTLWFRLFKYPWEDRSFPRPFKLYFDTISGGGKEPWSGKAWGIGQPIHLVEKTPGCIEFWRGSKLALAFHAPWNAKPGFHPLTTPGGQVLTVDGPRDHPWHHGLMFGWKTVECAGKSLRDYTFWGEPGGGVRHVSDFGRKHCGPVLGCFESRTVYCGQDGEPVFDFTVAARYQPIDIGWDWLDIDLTVSARDEALRFKSDYGHVYLRASLGLRNVVAIDSAGKELRDGGQRDAAEVDWIGMSGELERPAGILLLNAPSNPGGKPIGDATVSLRGDMMDHGALFGTLELNPLRTRAFDLRAGQSATWRYRVVTTDRLLTGEFGKDQYHHWITPWVVQGLPSA